jgi:Beta-ketoacyl synthase, N-terminal domain
MTMSALQASIESVGVIGPGFADWPATARILSGASAWDRSATALPPPLSLPSAERRRTGAVVRLALAVGLEAAGRAGVDPSGLATVFSSSGSDGENCHEICEVLASAERQLSPTRFHNSVHNAPAGYWGIATGATAPANSLCAHDASFGAGLLEAVCQVVVERTRVLLIAYDTSYPEPMRAVRPIPEAFGVALLLAPAGAADSLSRIELARSGACADRMDDAALELLRASIPAARSLPLLALLARGASGCVRIDYLDGARIELKVSHASGP